MMKKNLPSVKQLGLKKQNGKSIYGIEISFPKKEEELTVEVWKSYSEYFDFEQYFLKKTFDLDQLFTNNKQKNSDEETMTTIFTLITEMIKRKDIFVGIPEINFELVEESNQLLTFKDGYVLVDFCWEPQQMMIMSLMKVEETFSKVSKIFNTFFSAKSNKNGNVKFFQEYNDKWKLVEVLQLQAEPLQMKWNRKSSLLIINTIIGISIYSLSFHQGFKLQLLQFIKQFEIRDFCFYAVTGATYFCNQEDIKVHSINKQFTMKVNIKPMNKVRSLGIQEGEERLYLSSQNYIRIYDITQLKQTKEIGKIQTDCSFETLLISQNYLFALSNFGYISVLDLKPKGKEKLISVLTNIDCSENARNLAYSHKNQTLFLNKNKYLTIISTKNEPLFVGGKSESNISKIEYDEENNLLLSGSEGGQIIFYNICIDLSYDQ